MHKLPCPPVNRSGYSALRHPANAALSPRGILLGVLWEVRNLAITLCTASAEFSGCGIEPQGYILGCLLGSLESGNHTVHRIGRIFRVRHCALGLFLGASRRKFGIWQSHCLLPKEDALSSLQRGRAVISSKRAQSLLLKEDTPPSPQ